MNVKFPTLISLLLGLISSITILLLMPNTTYSAQGIFLPTTSNRFPPFHGQVDVINYQPTTCKNVGMIHIERHLTKNIKLAEKQVINLATSLAAKHGGNTIAIQTLSKSAPSDEGNAAASIIFYGEAIKC